MALSEEQKGTVAKWFAAGAGVAEIQKRISEEFGIDMTYLDVRLMVADLPQPVEPEPEIPEERNESVSENQESPDDLDNSEIPEEQGDLDNLEGSDNTGIGELSVSVDPLAPPGAIACGSVVFSDGKSGKWMLDQMGRLGLSGLPEGYRPSPEDGAQFQPKLLAALRAKGLA